MPTPTPSIELNSTTPPAPAGYRNAVPQSDNGSPLARVTLAMPAIVSVVGVTIDGGDLTPLTGSKGFVRVLYAGTIKGWTVIADRSGSASFTVKKSTFAAFPTNSSIVASAPPALSSQQKASSTTLTGWTTAVAAGDVIEFVLDSVATVHRLTLELQIERD